MKHLQIIPDNQIENSNVETIARSMCNYKPLLSRYNKSKKRFDQQPFLSFEILLEKENPTFTITVQDGSEEQARKSIESTWSKATIREVEDPLSRIRPIAISEVGYYHHHFLSLRVDKRSNSFMISLLDTLHMMKDKERVFVQILAFPACYDWYIGAAEAYKRFKNGSMPTKLHFDKKFLTRTALKLTAKAFVELSNGLVSLTGGKPEKIDFDEFERASVLKDGFLRPETLQKVKGDAYDVSIRIASEAADQTRAKELNRLAFLSFRSFDGDNFLVDREVNYSKAIKSLTRRNKGLKMQKDYFSIPEISRMLMLPPYYLQEKFSIERVSSLESALPDHILNGGLWIAEHTIKGKQQNIYFPVDDWDELCLPRVVIGGMGSGKTKGFAANWICQTVEKGFGAVAIDPAKGEIGDEVQNYLSPDKVIRINVAELMISLDWREALHSEYSKGRLANTILSFFANSTDEAGAQTSRYIRAAVMAMKGGKLSEVLKILEDKEYREKRIKALPEGIHRTTLQDLHDHSDGRRRQILEPILNRFDSILGDPFLEKCFQSEQGIDFVELMSQKKAVIIDVPKTIVGKEGVEIIGSLLSTKIDLAMTLRKEEDQFPFFVVADEPHQYSKSAKVWESAAVESRKWRVGYVWLFHEWKQVDFKLRDIIKSALPHYHIYSSSKKIFEDLLDELKPFTIDDLLKIKRHHAVNVIRSGGEYIKPFLAHMAPPPSKQTRNVKNKEVKQSGEKKEMSSYEVFISPAIKKTEQTKPIITIGSR
ncbi:ATP-binding protein [Bacillus cereus group sp. BfR-BA-01489]|uniref:ATP-binding protein n=1 Tax=Bacillus cereus group sp. BfR-BA-01489 TaxID=2920358 RepID=UPI001F560C3B